MVNITCTNIIFKDVGTAQVSRRSEKTNIIYLFPGLETGLETVDQQQQDQQRLSHGEPQETLDETQVSYCSYD